jgi:hypothetical protein
MSRSNTTHERIRRLPHQGARHGTVDHGHPSDGVFLLLHLRVLLSRWSIFLQRSPFSLSSLWMASWCEWLPLLALSLHYVKTSNRSRNICNGPLSPVTSTHICNGCCLAPVTYKCARTTPGLASQCSLPMWTSGNGLLKRPLHKFFVTDVKRARYKC